jgi:hypothetical protein
VLCHGMIWSIVDEQRMETRLLIRGGPCVFTFIIYINWHSPFLLILYLLRGYVHHESVWRGAKLQAPSTVWM